MRRTSAATALLAAMVAATAAGQKAGGVIDNASHVMGVAGLDAVTYSGAAAIGNFGQSRTISFGLTSTPVADYTQTIDFTQRAARTTGITTPAAVPGAPPAPRGVLDRTITADAPWIDQLQIWTTPWGFLRGAAAGDATVRSRKIDGTTYDVVTWTPPQKAPSGQPYRVVGYIGPDHLVHRAETWVEHPVFGDMHVETFFTNYRDAGGGLKVPARIAQRLVGMETFVVGITSARANPPDLEQLLTPGAGADRADTPAPAPNVPAASEKVAEGVYRITGGSTSLAVEFRDYVVVIEGGDNEARGAAILAEAKRLFPNKRIKYVVNTHPHFDHAAGLPPFAAEGITILTDDPNRYFLEQAFRQPRTLLGDLLARSRKKARVESVVEKMVLQDATRTIELHHIERLEHSDGMLVAYLPKERILFTADFDIPAPGQPPGASILTLARNIERLQLDFDRHMTVHSVVPDRPATSADLLALLKAAR